MNQTTSKCGTWCYYYFNGQCTKADGCVSNYNERPDENNSINESYNPYIGVNESYTPNTSIGEFYSPYSDKFTVAKHTPPKIIHIDCEEIYLTKGALEIKIDLTSLDFNNTSQIIINGVKFNKEQ